MSELLDPREFYYFCKALRIDTKEEGVRSLGERMLSSQLRLLKEIQIGVEEGVHEFVTLKCRQIGCSTLSLAIDMYQVYRNHAMNGALITHDEGARDGFRTTLALYRSGLDEDWQREVVDDNRNQLVFDNGSRLRFLVAGTRSRTNGSSKLGRSGALVLAHATEVAFWGDGTGVDALRASFAQQNPQRFFHWESTANGENWFRDMWEDAKRAQSVRAIFVSWWANEYYGLPRDSKLYAHYWGTRGKPTREEAAISRQVEHDYGAQYINDCQWAWYRWMQSEKITDELQMRQEYPHTETDAFISTGSLFFRIQTLSALAGLTKGATKSCTHHRVEFGRSFPETTVADVRPQHANLIMWANPVAGAWYVLGVDPAYAANPESDNSVVSVWRCWYNRMEQVAEFVDRTVSTHAVAWAMTYLAGFYGKSCLNLEVNGPGTAVLQEFTNMRRQAYSGWSGDRAVQMRNVVGAIKQYLYRRPDSQSGPTTFLHTKTTAEVKDRIMNGLRDGLERETVIPMSEALILEMGAVKREGGGAPGAPNGRYDDRVISAALAVQCWNDQLRSQLLAQGVFWKDAPAVKRGEPESPVQRVVDKYMARLGFVPDGVPRPKRSVLSGQRKWSGKIRVPLQGAENSRSR